MTITSTSIEDAFRTAVLLAGSNTNVIFQFPNAPRPTLPYSSIQYLAVSPEINDWEIFDEDDEVNRTFGFRDVTMTLNCFGDNARTEAQTLQGNLRKQTVRDAMRENIGISIMTMTGITDLTALVDNAYEQRTSFDVTLNVNIEDGSTEDNTGFFDTVVEPIEWIDKP